MLNKIVELSKAVTVITWQSIQTFMGIVLLVSVMKGLCMWFTGN